MKYTIQWLLVLLTLLNPILANAALTDFDRQELAFKNWLAPYNSGFESGKAKWTASGGTFTAVTSGSNLLDGKGSFTWNASASGQTLTSQAITVPNGGFGLDCEVEILAQVPSGTATHYVRAFDGTNPIAFQSIVSSTTPRWNAVTFPCPSSGTVALQFYANADEPLIAGDLGYIGRSKRVGSTQLSTEPVSYTPTIGLTGGTTSASAKWQRIGPDIEVWGDVTFTTVFTGGAATVSLPSVCTIDTTKFPTTPATGVGIIDSKVYFYDVGSGQYGGTVTYNDTSSVLLRTLQDDVGAGGNHVFADAAITTTIPFTWVNNDRLSFKFKVPCVGWTAQTVVMPDAQGWYVDASISGANVGLGTTSVSSYSPIGSSTLTMTKASGSADVMVPCSGGNAPSGLTCSAGSELFGAAFNIPKSGAYRVCLSANHYIDAPAGSINVVSTFQLVETSTTSDTILQEGKGKAMSGSVSISGDRREYRSVYTCGDFVFSSVGQKVVKLMYETEISGTPDNHYIKADGDTVLGQPDVHITVYPLQDRATAILANSVNSPSANGTNFGSSQVGSTGTVSKETGDWVSGSCSVASAVYTCTLVAGAFSTDPACHATIFGETTSYNAVVTSASTSSVVVRTFDTGNSAAAAAFTLTCSSPR